MTLNYFTYNELACKHCGENHFDDSTLAKLNAIRDRAGFPFILSSAYRCSEHPVEKAKGRLGEHQTGKAVDVLCWGTNAKMVLHLALKAGVPRIGISQKGEHGQRFIHLGWNEDFPSGIWSY